MFQEPPKRRVQDNLHHTKIYMTTTLRKSTTSAIRRNKSSTKSIWANNLKRSGTFMTKKRWFPFKSRRRKFFSHRLIKVVTWNKKKMMNMRAKKRSNLWLKNTMRKISGWWRPSRKLKDRGFKDGSGHERKCSKNRRSCWFWIPTRYSNNFRERILPSWADLRVHKPSREGINSSKLTKRKDELVML